MHAMLLYEPIKIKNVELVNRIAIAPMCPFGVEEGEDNSIGDAIIEYYRRRFETQPGLVISHAFTVSGKVTVLRGFGLRNEKQLADVKKLADMAHNNNSRLVIQLSYPSGGHHRHDTIDFWKREELEEIKESFIECALNVKNAGCDGVELHGANMFFLNLFSSPITNHRIDEYGGDVNGRLKLAKDIVRGIKAFADDNFLVGYRMGWNKDLDTDIETAKTLEEIGIDYFHISYGIRESDRYMPKEYPDYICYPGTTRERQISPDNFDYNDVVYTGAEIHKHIKTPVILVDEIWTLQRGEELLNQNCGDIIAYGRPFLGDDKFLVKGREDPSYRGCYECKECAWFYDCTKCPRVKQRGYL